jgi:hypothetical protein
VGVEDLADHWVCCAVHGLRLSLLTPREGVLTLWPIMTRAAAKDDGGPRVSTPSLRSVNEGLAMLAYKRLNTLNQA